MILETRGLSKHFGALAAADDVNISVAEREVVGIIGANGAGKTTFVNLVTGYLAPTSGSILYRGQDITALGARAVTRLGIHRSFQIAQVFPDISVLDNLTVTIGIAGGAPTTFWRPLRSAATEAEAEAILERYGIEEYRDHNAGVLPQGVRKLLDIAMATVGAPSVLLLDEPTSGISADQKVATMDTVMSALDVAEVTILFVEHDMEIVSRYARRVVAFYDGRIIANGTPAAVLDDANVRQYVIGPELSRDRRPREDPDAGHP